MTLQPRATQQRDDNMLAAILPARLTGALMCLTIVAGCAGIDAWPEKTNDLGVRYYTQAPFLLVHTDGKGGLTSELIWLPDTTKVMTIRPYTYLAKNEGALKFDEGVLTSAKSVADETAIPNAILGALKTAAIAALNAPTASDTVPSPRLFKILINGDTISLIGNEAQPQHINITIPPKKADK